MITQKEVLQFCELKNKLCDELENYLKSIGIMTDKHLIDNFEIYDDIITVTYHNGYEYSPQLHEYEVPIHVFPR